MKTAMLENYVYVSEGINVQLENEMKKTHREFVTSEIPQRLVFIPKTISDPVRKAGKLFFGEISDPVRDGKLYRCERQEQQFVFFENK